MAFNDLLAKLQGLKERVDALEAERDDAVARAEQAEVAKVEAEQSRDEARARVQVVENEKAVQQAEFEAQFQAINDLIDSIFGVEEEPETPVEPEPEQPEVPEQPEPEVPVEPEQPENGENNGSEVLAINYNIQEPDKPGLKYNILY